MKIQKTTFKNHSVKIISKEKSDSKNIIYIHLYEDCSEQVYELLTNPKPVIVSIGTDWNGDMTPWYAPSLYKKEKDFSGNAENYLKILTKDIVPFAENIIGFKPENRCITGYSLAGLFAVYAALNTHIFSAFASISGSLWYDGFEDYTDSKNSTVRYAYFSLGNKEKNTRNSRMSKVENSTLSITEKFRQKGIKTDFEFNNGNHFQDIPLRIAKAINSISNSL